MAKPYITTLQERVQDKAAALFDSEQELMGIITYLQSSKFHGVDKDYVHVSTDIMPKLTALLSTIRTGIEGA